MFGRDGEKGRRVGMAMGAGIPCPHWRPPYIREKFPPPTGMRMGTGVNFHPYPSSLREISPSPSPFFCSRLGKNLHPLFSLLDFS